MSAIGELTKIKRKYDEPLETWWFKPKQEEDL
jgi:hypothetical protein